MQGLEAGIGDRRRRQANVQIGIEWRIKFEVGSADGIRPPGFLKKVVPHCILHSWVGIEFHADPELPLLGQDVWVIEREQNGWQQFWDRPAPELSPVVRAFQDLTIRKWQEYLDSRGRTAEAACGNVVSAKELVR